MAKRRKKTQAQRVEAWIAKHPGARTSAEIGRALHIPASSVRRVVQELRARPQGLASDPLRGGGSSRVAVTRSRERIFNYEVNLGEVELSEVPEIAQTVVDESLLYYSNHAAVIHVKTRQYDKKGNLIREQWVAMTTTHKLRASVNNLEAEIDAWESTIGGESKQGVSFTATALRFQIWL